MPPRAVVKPAAAAKKPAAKKPASKKPVTRSASAPSKAKAASELEAAAKNLLALSRQLKK